MKRSLKSLVTSLVIVLVVAVVSISAVSGVWKQDYKGWWFQYSQGGYPKEMWELIRGKWYHFDADGYMNQSELVHDGTGTAYVGEDGAMWANRWVYVENKDYIPKDKWYYLGSNGYAYRKAWVGDYYLDALGGMLISEFTHDGYFVDHSGRYDKSLKYDSTKTAIIDYSNQDKNYVSVLIERNNVLALDIIEHIPNNDEQLFELAQLVKLGNETEGFDFYFETVAGSPFIKTTLFVDVTNPKMCELARNHNLPKTLKLEQCPENYDELIEILHDNDYQLVIAGR